MEANESLIEELLQQSQDDEEEVEMDSKGRDLLISSQTEVEFEGIDLTKLPPSFISLSRLSLQRIKITQTESFSRLPNELSMLLNLQALTIEHTNLSELPKSIGELKKLKRIYIRNNKLKSLPSSLWQCSDLEELLVSHNLLTINSFPPGMNSLLKLNSLDLSENDFSTLPEDVCLIEKLESLRLINCSLIQLPTQVKWKNLKVLYIDNNHLKSLPSSLNVCTNLEKLYGDRNELDSVEMQFNLMSSLDTIYFQRSKLTSLPLSFSPKALTSVYLTENELSVFPIGVLDCLNLKRLVLAKNLIREIPPEIGLLVKLTVLNIDNNKIRQLPDPIGKLKALRVLSACYNQLRSLPSSISSLKSLSSLNLDHNEIMEIPDSIGSCSSLNEITLVGNRLRNLPSELGSLSSLSYITLDANELNSSLMSAYYLSLPSLFQFLRDPRATTHTELHRDDVNFEDLEFKSLLGQGAFGQVYSGIWKPPKRSLSSSRRISMGLKEESDGIERLSIPVAIKLPNDVTPLDSRGGSNSSSDSNPISNGKLELNFQSLSIATTTNIQPTTIPSNLPLSTTPSNLPLSTTPSNESQGDSKEKKYERFLKEVAMLRKTREAFSFSGSRDHFIQFYGACTRQPRVCIVTELAERGTLYGMLRRYLNLDLSLKTSFALQIAEAMNSLHSYSGHSIIHHDLKTANILVKHDFSIRLADFGLSKIIWSNDPNQQNHRISSQSPNNQNNSGQNNNNINNNNNNHNSNNGNQMSLSQSGSRLISQSPAMIDSGSRGKERGILEKSLAYVRYAAPEVLQGGAYEQPADIFSFGVVLYEVFHQKEAFAGCTKQQIKDRVISGERPKISTSEVPPMVGELIGLCWHQNAAKRPSFSSTVQLLRILVQSFPQIIVPTPDEEHEADDRGTPLFFPTTGYDD